MQNHNLKFKIFKTFYFLPVFLTFYFFLFTFPAFAHVLQSSGSVGAVLHIEPEDDPIVGQKSSFFFEFKDKEGKFNLGNCDCVFSIAQDEKEIYSQPLSPQPGNSSLTSASISYAFSKKGDYEVKVAGKPNQANTFQPFALEFEVKVSREAGKEPTTASTASAGSWISTHVVHLIGAFVVLAFLIFALLKQQRETRT